VLGNGGRDGGVHDVAEGGQADDDLVNVSVGEILEDGGDEHDEEIGVLVEEEGAHQVADPLEHQIFALGEVDGVDVSEGGGVAEHLDVQSTYEILFDLFICEIFLCEFFFDEDEFVENDAVFFLFGLGLSDAFDEFFEFFGEVGRGCGHDCANYYQADKSHLFNHKAAPSSISCPLLSRSLLWFFFMSMMRVYDNNEVEF
jgi:hypothetical protein